MSGQYKFRPTATLPLKAIGMMGFTMSLTPEQEQMKLCFNNLPEMWQNIVVRDAQRDGYITGMSLLEAERNAAMEKAQEWHKGRE